MEEHNYTAIIERFKSNTQTDYDIKVAKSLDMWANTWSEQVRALKRAHHHKTKKKRDLIVSQGRLFPVDEDYSVLNKQILRSSLFGIDRRGKRAYVDNELIAKGQNFELSYTGPRLQQTDLDCLFGVLSLLSDFSQSGNVVDEIVDTSTGAVQYSRIRCKAYGLIEACKKSDGGKQKEWAWKALQRLSLGELIYRSPSIDFHGSILGNRAKNPETDDWIIDINQHFINLFKNDQFSYIDTEQRSRLGKNFIKWLHGFVSTYTGESYRTTEQLMEACGSTRGRPDKFVSETARPAFEQLLKNGIIETFSYKKGVWYWVRN